MAWRNPIHTLPFDEPIHNDLAREFREQRLGRRIQAVRKAAWREVALWVSGQALRRVERVPASTRSMLWVQTWTSVGDAIMDLAPRVIVPPQVEVELLIPPHLVPLFDRDRRFGAVHGALETCPHDVDLLLLDVVRTPSLRLKNKHFRHVTFASMRGHQAGERMDRTAFADRRIRQLFGLPAGEVVQPTLDLGEPLRKCSDAARFPIAVPLGALVPRKRYAHWNRLLGELVERWPRDAPPPLFRFVGQGESARDDLRSIDAALIAAHADVQIDAGDLRKAAFDIGACAAFLGADGGLMHVSVAVGTPGLALFAGIDPAYFLRPNSAMRSLRGAREVSDLAPEPVAEAFLSALPTWLANRSAGPLRV